MAMRNTYDLSHYSFMCGKMGRLMTLSTIPIVAGDSLSLHLNGAFRLSPLRRDLAMDAFVDTFAFFVPYRHVYGEHWLDFIRDGYDASSTVSRDGSNTMRFQSNTISEPLEYLGWSNIDGTSPRWLLEGYNKIWNRYFRIPNGPVAEVNDNAQPADADSRLYGRTCARLRSLPLSGINSTLETDDFTLAVPAPGNRASIDLKALALKAARYKTELSRDWFNRRYNDIMKSIYDSNINADADERPTLIMRSSNWMSGYDVEGTGDATLGQYSGKAAMITEMGIPRRFYPEHGTLWIMALVRFPTIFESERHYLLSKGNFSYAQVAGDPTIGERCAPVVHSVQEFFDSTSNVQLGLFPWEQWYRTHPSTIHRTYQNIGGFPFLKDIPTSHSNVQYYQPGDYEDMFATTQLGHWRSQLRIAVQADRVVASPTASIFAGTKI